MDLIEGGADVFQRNQNNQLCRQCAKVNYIMTKCIKLIEERTLRKRFKRWNLVESKLALLRQAKTHNVPSSNIAKSKMQPI